MTETKVNYSETVARGIILLDWYHTKERNLPDWRETLRNGYKLEGGDFYSLSTCVLGRIFGDYSAGLRALWRMGPGEAVAVNYPILHGFAPGNYNREHELAAEWNKALGL